MSRAKKMRMRQVRRNRRITAVIGILFLALILSILFTHLNVTAQKPQAYKYYTDIRVQREDTLLSIAREYMTEEYKNEKEYIREVQQINHIGNVIEYGQCLIVPYYSEEVK